MITASETWQKIIRLLWDNEHEDEREESTYAQLIGTVHEERDFF